MAKSEINGVRIAGVASAVPNQARNVVDEAVIFGAAQAEKVSQNIGVQTRHIAPPNVCTSDLCYSAATRLLTSLGWQPQEITGLIFVTQTPDYVLPATSHSLHRRLGLSASCYAFDVNLGCSGYVYGLWLASSLIKTTGGKVLLLVGDTISKVSSPNDQSVALLFGDAGTATALESAVDQPAMHFELGADGSGESSLIIPAGGFRYPRNASSGIRTLREGDNVRSDEDLFMDGPAVFTFSLRIPGLVKSILQSAGCELSDIDALVFHQANRFMLNHLAKRIKIPSEKLVVALDDYGNTSSASIPLAISTSELRHKLETSSLRLLLAGFGVGFSWAATVLTCGPGVFPEVVEYTAPAPTERQDA